MTILIKNKHTLQIDEFTFRCCIGKKGLTKNKKEGDKKTPIGTFKIENLYFRKDRLKKPLTLLKCVEIKKNMGWCDDIHFPKKYNKLIKIKNIILKDKKSIKGEFVAVIDRQTLKSQDFDEIDLYKDELKKMIKKFSLTDIVEIVHKFTKINKNKIYKWLLNSKK